MKITISDVSNVPVSLCSYNQHTRLRNVCEVLPDFSHYYRKNVSGWAVKHGEIINPFFLSIQWLYTHWWLFLISRAILIFLKENFWYLSIT